MSSGRISPVGQDVLTVNVHFHGAIANRRHDHHFHATGNIRETNDRDIVIGGLLRRVILCQ
jgi:hypothetical protein